LVADLEDWMREQRAKLSRGNNVAKATDCLLTRWTVFTRFLDDGRVCIGLGQAARHMLRAGDIAQLVSVLVPKFRARVTASREPRKPRRGRSKSELAQFVRAESSSLSKIHLASEKILLLPKGSFCNLRLIKLIRRVNLSIGFLPINQRHG
jgi:hypothetical protein